MTAGTVGFAAGEPLEHVAEPHGIAARVVFDVAAVAVVVAARAAAGGVAGAGAGADADTAVAVDVSMG